jgi:ABC-2 type transport system ATP-binding protein
VEAASRELAIETHGLTVDYGGGAGVHDVELTVGRGEVFGFLGRNGAGKTTTIRTLLDLRRPDRGEVRVLGVAVREGGAALRQRIGYLPGDLALFGHLTGERTLDLFARLSRRPPVRREELLDRLHFPREALRRRVSGWSTGMRQMLGITLAAQHDPELLVLDEPTSGLDPLVRDAFLAFVRDCAARGQTVFLSSHVLDEVERCARRVAIVHGGRLRATVDLHELEQAAQRVVTLRWRGGSSESFESREPAARLLEVVNGRIAARRDAGELVDVEIRPLGLDQVFRRVVGEASV